MIASHKDLARRLDELEKRYDAQFNEFFWREKAALRAERSRAPTAILCQPRRVHTRHAHSNRSIALLRSSRLKQINFEIIDYLYLRCVFEAKKRFGSVCPQLYGTSNSMGRLRFGGLTLCDKGDNLCSDVTT
jgi:hypothetical protein